MKARTERRRLLGAGALGCAALLLHRAAKAALRPSGATVALQAPVPMAQLHVNAQGMLFGLSTQGELWQLDAAGWRRAGAGLDPAAPLASGHGRVVGRSRDGGLWVSEGGRVSMQRQPLLAPQAGLLVLAFAVIAVAAAADGRSYLVRLESTPGGWRESARSAHEVLPDARPLQFDPDGRGSDANGHVVVFASPDAERYRHGVLGDAVEPRSILLLERHGLEPMAGLELPAPYVFEDIAPRAIAWRGRRALLTVRAGLQGAQLAVVARSGNGNRFELAALGEPIGTRHRWLSPSSDGVRLWAVHTPHLGGVVQRYRSDGDRLVGEVVGHGVSNHALGERELDVSVWTERAWVLPTQDRRSLRFFDLGSDSAVPRQRDVALAQPVVQLARWSRQGEQGVAVLHPDGSVSWLPFAS
jgi:hypothetical protein